MSSCLTPWLHSGVKEDLKDKTRTNELDVFACHCMYACYTKLTGASYSRPNPLRFLRDQSLPKTVKLKHFPRTIAGKHFERIRHIRGRRSLVAANRTSYPPGHDLVRLA